MSRLRSHTIGVLDLNDGGATYFGVSSGRGLILAADHTGHSKVGSSSGVKGLLSAVFMQVLA